MKEIDLKHKSWINRAIALQVKLIISFLIISGYSYGKTIDQVSQYGMYEISFELPIADLSCYFPQVTFYTPSGDVIKVDGFFDGKNSYKVRAYCKEKGLWKWELNDTSGFTEKKGIFNVVDSELKGKLKKHPEDSYQFVYENGEWFLHIGDTGYRYLAATEPKWKEYIDQASDIGMTKIRTWFCSSRSGVEALFNEERTTLNIPFWQEMDKRIAYAFENHSNIIFQLIPFGEDTKELKRYYDNDSLSLEMLRYAQARFSAFPNVTWCISNDREIATSLVDLSTRKISKENIEKIGVNMAAREPWGTLITNHQSRYSGYSFVDSPWSDIITLEDLDQVDGSLILKYRLEGDDPVVLDEDRYELYRKPENPRYYFRRLMWVSLLSGGHATYCGIHTYAPFNDTVLYNLPEEEKHLFGVQGYYDVNIEGANDFKHITNFFEETGLTLVNMKPADELTGDIPQQVKCMHNDSIYIVYIANPDKIGRLTTSNEEGDEIRMANEAQINPKVTITLPESEFSYKWYNPTKGEWSDKSTTKGGVCELTANGPGDWVLLIVKDYTKDLAIAMGKSFSEINIVDERIKMLTAHASHTKSIREILKLQIILVRHPRFYELRKNLTEILANKYILHNIAYRDTQYINV